MFGFLLRARLSGGRRRSWGIPRALCFSLVLRGGVGIFNSLMVLLNFIAGIPAYFRRGFKFSRTSPCGSVSAGTVVLIHGLLMRGASMRWLAERFSEKGFRCFCYDYPTSRLGIFRHGEILRKRLVSLFETLPPDEKIFFVTHSMGGILLRVALSELSQKWLARVNAVVMLAPPNQGSYWPERIRKFFPASKIFNRCLGDLRHTADSPLRKIPLPRHGAFPRLCIVCGERDAKVAPEFLPLPGVVSEMCSAPCGHAALRHSRKAFEHALEFLARES